MSLSEKNFPQNMGLIDLVSTCPCFISVSSRLNVILQLRLDIRENILFSLRGATKTEPAAIIDKCLDFTDGLTDLLRVIQLSDSNTVQFRALETYVTKLDFKILAPKRDLVSNNLLPARNPDFIGREAELNALHHTLQSNKTGLAILQGQPGIGKTSLVLEYCYRYQEDYNLIIWLHAENILTLQQEFINLASLLKLPELPAVTEAEQARTIEVIKQAIERRRAGWLIIFDNVQKAEDIELFLPKPGTGHAIITNSNKLVVRHGQVVSVERLAKNEAEMLLAIVATGQNSPQWASEVQAKTVQQLAQELDYLALGIIQAGNYIAATGSTLENYLNLYSKTKAELFNEEQAKSPNFSPVIKITWKLIFDRISELNSGATELLSLWACFATNPIELSWFVKVDSRATTKLPEALTELLETENSAKLTQAIALLQKFSLITVKAEAVELPLHVQKLIQAQTNRAQWLNRAVTFLAAILPDAEDYKSWPDYEKLLPHLQNVIALTARNVLAAGNLPENDFKPEVKSLISLAGNTGCYLGQQGFYKDALPYIELALKLGEQTLASEDAELAKWLDEKASLLTVEGNYTEAQILYERAIAIGEKTLGAEHPEVAKWLNNLADLLIDQVEYTAAKPIYERAIGIIEKTLGSEHPDLVIPLNNLAVLLRNTANYETAKPIFERAIAIGEKAWKGIHPKLAMCFNSFAGLLQGAGDYEKAKLFSERAIIIGEKTLGSSHPIIAGFLNNLAHVSNAQGDFNSAKLLYKQAITIRERRLGGEHFLLASLLNSLGNILREQGDYDAAKPLLEKALEINEKTLGNEHLTLTFNLNCLGLLFYETKNYTEAKPLLERSIKLREKVLGNEHPDLTTPLNDLALVLAAQGNYDEAKSLYKRAIAITEETFGSNHPVLATRLNNLAIVLQAQGNHKGAKILWEKAIEIGEKTLGAEHPRIGMYLGNLGWFYLHTEEYELASEHLKRALAIHEAKLGAEHWRTKQVIENLQFAENKLAAINEANKPKRSFWGLDNSKKQK